MYDPVLDERRAEFGVSGLLYNNSVVLYDRETLGLWPQLTATAISGDYEGRTLAVVPFTDTTWGAWRAEHPGTLVLSTATGYGRNYGLPAYATSASPTIDDRRLPADAYVWGISVGDSAKAYPTSLLAKMPMEFTDELSGQPLLIRNDPPGVRVQAELGDGTVVPVTRVRWFAWALTHPDTDLYALPATAME